MRRSIAHAASVRRIASRSSSWICLRIAPVTGKMWSNQLRLYFSSITYVLLQTLRRTALAGTELAKAQCGTIRLKLLKIGAQIRVTVRKIWIKLSESYPYAELFAHVLATLEADCAT